MTPDEIVAGIIVIVITSSPVVAIPILKLIDKIDAEEKSWKNDRSWRKSPVPALLAEIQTSQRTNKDHEV